MKLWSYWRSSSAYRVRIALELKQLEYEYVPTHLLQGGGAQHLPEFQVLNPHRQVPVLEVTEAGEKRLLVQSMAIIEYLEECYPAPPLLPRAPADRAHVRALAELVNSGIQPQQNLATLQRIAQHGGDRDEWARHFITRGLTSLEAMAAPRAGRFLFGDAPGLADVFLVPQLYNARRYAIPLGDFPTLLRAGESAEALPAFQKAKPEAQPDAEA